MRGRCCCREEHRTLYTRSGGLGGPGVANGIAPGARDRDSQPFVAERKRAIQWVENGDGAETEAGAMLMSWDCS